MKVLIADKFPESGRQKLTSLGLDLTYSPEAHDVAATIADHAILIVRSAKVSKNALQAGANLQLVVRAGAGVNTIDVESASELGIFVANCPGKNAVAVAELTLGLLVALDRRIAQADHALKMGQWRKKEYSQAAGLFDKTLGIIGVGQIGAEVCARARAFGMKVVGWSRSLSDERARELGMERASSLNALARKCDAVTIHLPLNSDSKNLIGSDFFQLLRERALVVNAARDGIVDEQAVLEAIEKRGLRYATDVFAHEPAGGEAPFEHPLARHPNVIATPHIGAATEQAQDAVAAETVRIVECFVREGRIPNVVNICKQSPAHYQLNVRHLDRVGVLAAVLGALREDAINVEEVENIIFDGAKAACARIRLSQKPSEKLLQKIGALNHVLGAQLAQL